MRLFTQIVLLAATTFAAAASFAKEVKLLNVSYDPTRELYREYNSAFAKYWQAKPVICSPLSNPTAAPARNRGR